MEEALEQRVLLAADARGAAMTVAMSSSPPASPELPNAVPDASSADGTAGSSGSAATADLASSPSANGAVATMPNGAARLQRNKRVIQSKVQGMGMISHVRRRSVIASTYGVELSPEDDRHSPEARKSATADYGATFKGRERGTGEQPTCCDRCFPIQTEDSKFRKTWDKIQIVALLYVAVLVPIRSGFDLEDLELEPLHFDWWIDVLVDLYFIADIFTNFRQGYQDVDGSMEMRPKKIAINYARSWLIIDIVSCLPIQYILHISDALQNVDANDAGGRDAGGQAAQIKGIKILRLLRLTKLLRLARVKRIIRRYEDHFEGLGSFVKLITATVVVLYTAHLIACFWHAVGGDENDPRGNLVQGWINTEWPEAVGNSSAITFGERYLTSMYWSITTLSTVGFGDISPQTQMERVFCLFAEIFGCLMFATIIGTVSSVAMGQKLLEEKVTRQLAELREFLASKGISRDLRIRVRRYMETLYAAKTGFDEAEVLAQLPPPMAQEVIDCLYHEQIRNVPMFRSLEDGALATICMRMRPFKAMREDWIYKTGEAGREMYIIIDGKVALRGPRGPPRLLNTGAVFGEGCVSQLVAELEWQNSKEEPMHPRRTQPTRTCSCFNLLLMKQASERAS